MKATHDAPLASDQGYFKTYRQVRERFSWKGIKDYIWRHVTECTAFQKNKVDYSHPTRLLQPLSITDKKRESISMDFIIELPRVQGKDCILVVVDRLTKFVHFMAIPSCYIAGQVLKLNYGEIFRLHRVPKHIVCDNHSWFVNTF